MGQTRSKSLISSAIIEQASKLIKPGLRSRNELLDVSISHIQSFTRQKHRQISHDSTSFLEERSRVIIMMSTTLKASQYIWLNKNSKWVSPGNHSNTRDLTWKDYAGVTNSLGVHGFRINVRSWLSCIHVYSKKQPVSQQPTTTILSSYQITGQSEPSYWRGDISSLKVGGQCN